MTPIIGVFGTAWYTWKNGFEWWMLGLFAVLYTLIGLSITAGYHRFFAHKTYEASKPVQYFFAFFGALAAQNSILWWAASHRVHHKYIDKEWDPYNIKRGFLWAHILWIFYRNPQSADFSNSPDLLANPVVMWQNRWTKFLVVVAGFGIPTLVGAMFGDAIAGLLWGGFLRIAAVHHSTFFVNSLAHTWGARTYSEEMSARDNWAVAYLTFGEGYHSFHHRFPSDFRNGIRWFDWDPSKWLIRGFVATGLASELKTTPAPMIETARMQAAFKRWQETIETAPGTRGEEIRQRVAAAREALEHSFALWKQHLEEKAAGTSRSWRAIRRSSRERAKFARKEWRSAIKLLRGMPETA